MDRLDMNQKDNQEIWFYELKGERRGGITESEIIVLLQNHTIDSDTHVWKKGFPDWLKIENTDLKQYISFDTPPPLSGKLVNNTIVWILAFSPLLSIVFEFLINNIISYDDFYYALDSFADGSFWYVSTLLFFMLSVWDVRLLAKSGINISKLKWTIILIPLYLYLRAKRLNHKLNYFFTWIATFLLSIGLMVILSTGIKDYLDETIGIDSLSRTGGIKLMVSDEFRQEFSDYVAELRAVSTHANSATASFSFVTGENYINDAELYNALIDEVIPNYEEYITRLKGVSNRYDDSEISWLNKQFLKAANLELKAYYLFVSAIENQDYEKVEDANEYLAQSQEISSKTTEKLQELYDEYSINDYFK